MNGVLAQHVESLLAAFGAIGLFVIVGLESVGAPLPGESAIIIAAAAAGAGKLDITQVILASYAGAVVGDNAGYLIGRKCGRPLIARHGPRIGITAKKYAHAESFARKYGVWMVIVARFFILLRQLNGLAAGTSGMKWYAFMMANAIGAALWVGLWSALAYGFGHSVSVMPFFWSHLGLIATILILCVFAAFIFFAVRARTGNAASDHR